VAKGPVSEGKRFIVTS